MLRLEDLKEYQRTRSVPAPVADPPAEGGAGPQDPPSRPRTPERGD
jgi:hypothetical protein